MAGDTVRSLTGREWEIRTSLPADDVDLGCGGPPVPGAVVSVLRARGVSDPVSWLRPDIRAFMPDPHVLPRMAEAAQRLARAATAGERVALLGDYDVDGATSAAQLSLWFESLTGDRPRIHIPDRLLEGYGPSISAVEALAKDGRTLLVIQDSGTGPAAAPPIARARDLGMDVVVIDHHEAAEGSPNPEGMFVNPKLPDSRAAGLEHLCTAGLTFLAAVAANRELRRIGWFDAARGRSEPDLRRLLGLVALGTVADVVPLVGLNRAYVRAGLGRMGENAGLAALMRETGREEPTAYDLGFVLGPCINAGGRMGDTSRGARLLASSDTGGCAALARELREANEERRVVQSRMLAEAAGMLESLGGVGAEDNVLVFHSPEWSPGVIGVAAGRMRESLERSVVFVGAGGKGSGRSVPGFNMGQAFLRAAADGLLVKGGGHAAAAGLTIDPARLGEFRAFLRVASAGVRLRPGLVEMSVGVAEAADLRLARALATMSPTGIGNPAPRVLVRGGTLSDPRIVGGRHVKATLREGRFGGGGAALDVMAFEASETALGRLLLDSEGRRLDLSGRLGENAWNGRNNARLSPEDAFDPGHA